MRLINVLRMRESFIIIWNYTVVVPLTQIIHPMFDRGKEMVKDVIVIIHDGIKKSKVNFSHK